MNRAVMMIACVLVIGIAGFASAAETNETVNPCHIIYISGNLDVGQSHTYGPYRISGCVTVDINWTPGCSTVGVALMSGDTVVLGYLFSGGSGTAYFCEQPPGSYSIRVTNYGMCSLTYSGAIIR